jgi:hypothetical protein
LNIPVPESTGWDPAGYYYLSFVSDEAGKYTGIPNTHTLLEVTETSLGYN